MMQINDALVLAGSGVSSQMDYPFTSQMCKAKQIHRFPQITQIMSLVS